MKACTSCGRLYPDDAGFCPVDGTGLTSATQAPLVADKNDPRIAHVPKVIETPKGTDPTATDAKMLARLRGYVARG